MPATKTTPRPQAAIRRFDVFAEYQRQQAISEGQPADRAKGYGLWLAKLVAARKFQRSKDGEAKNKDEDDAPERKRTKWRSLSGEPQTDKLFDKEIVGRMGSTFYTRVFRPAITQARKDGRSYEDIRDSLRKDWKPEKE